MDQYDIERCAAHKALPGPKLWDVVAVPKLLAEVDGKYYLLPLDGGDGTGWERRADCSQEWAARIAKLPSLVPPRFHGLPIA
jgi:hypothetical protein